VDALVEEGLLLPQEKPLLEDRPAKAMIAWGWRVAPFNGAANDIQLTIVWRINLVQQKAPSTLSFSF
jgi:hypothetical protein